MKTRTLGLGEGLLHVRQARAPWERMRGLLGRPPLAPDEALLLAPCRLVHTFGMRYPIDVVFLDRAGIVRGVAASVGSGTVRGCWRAWQTLELAAGGAARHGLAVGRQLPLGGAKGLA